MADEQRAPTASGGLDRTPVAHLLVYCLDRSLSGTLVLTHPLLGPSTLYVEGGAIIAMQPADLPAPTIDDEVLALFALPVESEFAFYDGANLLEAPAHLGEPLDPRGLIAAGLRSNPESVPLDKTLVALSNRRLRFMAPDLGLPFLADPLTAPVAWAVGKGESRIGELLNANVSSEIAIRTALYTMMILRVLDLGSVAKAPVASPRTRARHPKFPGASSIPPSAPWTSSPSTGSSISRISVATTQSGSIPAVRISTSSIPVANASSSSSIPAGSPASPGSPGPSRSSGSSVPPPSGSFATGSVSGVRLSTPPPDSLDDNPRFAEIRAIAAQIGKRTYYEALGVALEATEDEIKAAYFALARQWHPDRLAADLAPVRDAVSTVFARMSLAYQNLSEPGRRKAYDTELASLENPEEQAEVARVLDAASDFQKAEVMLKKGDVAAAEELALRAVRADPSNPDYDTLLSWLRANRPGSTPQDISLCIGVLDDVLKGHPDHQRALWYRGSLLKRMNRGEAALVDFRKLLKLKPNHVDAEREIRLFEMRQRDKPASVTPPAATGIGAIDSLKDKFGKLFNR